MSIRIGEVPADDIRGAYVSADRGGVQLGLLTDASTGFYGSFSPERARAIAALLVVAAEASERMGLPK